MLDSAILLIRLKHDCYILHYSTCCYIYNYLSETHRSQSVCLIHHFLTDDNRMDFETVHLNKTRIRDAMSNEGYFIIRHHYTNIQERDVNNIVAEMTKEREKDDHTVVTVKKGKRKKMTNDENRIQMLQEFDEQDEWLQDISNATRDLIEDLFYQKIEFVQSHASLLLSLNGCMEQELHSDFPANSSSSRTSYACVVFLQDGGKLLLQRGQETLVPHFNTGDIVVFRGDKLHAGASYDQANLCVHYHFYNTTTHFVEDATFVPNSCENQNWQDNENHIENRRRRCAEKKARNTEARSRRMQELNKRIKK